jgi:hypothetical protein
LKQPKREVANQTNKLTSQRVGEIQLSTEGEFGPCNMMTFVVAGLVLSLLLVLILSGVIVRKWLQRRADLRIWAERERQLKQAPKEESTETWRENQRMWMR